MSDIKQCLACRINGEAMVCKRYEMYLAIKALMRSLPIIGKYVSNDVPCPYYCGAESEAEHAE